jgi:SpoVK/Ycf46/Vps4 family AAA+-type ATPase
VKLNSLYSLISAYPILGIPHRRGILLHRPPGCGKTSLIVGLAGHLGLGIASLSLAEAGMTDSLLQVYSKTRSIVVLAGHLGFGIASLSLTEASLNDSLLKV